MPASSPRSLSSPPRSVSTSTPTRPLPTSTGSQMLPLAPRASCGSTWRAARTPTAPSTSTTGFTLRTRRSASVSTRTSTPRPRTRALVRVVPKEAGWAAGQRPARGAADVRLAHGSGGLGQEEVELDRDLRVDGGERHRRRRDPVVGHVDRQVSRDLDLAAAQLSLTGRGDVLRDPVDRQLAGGGYINRAAAVGGWH